MTEEECKGKDIKGRFRIFRSGKNIRYSIALPGKDSKYCRQLFGLNKFTRKEEAQIKRVRYKFYKEQGIFRMCFDLDLKNVKHH